MNNDFKKGLLIVLLICLLHLTLLNFILSIMVDDKKQKIDYQLEIINQTDVRLMDENGETLYITTFDSIGHYIEQDNL